MHDVTIIIPQRNQGELTRDCVRSLRRFEPDCDIVVVDDGSDDGSAEAVRQAEFSGCEIIEQSPRGVTAAWNLGIARCRTERIVLLNNDVLIEGPFLGPLSSPLAREEAHLAGPELRAEPLIPPRLLSQLPGRRILAGWCLAFTKVLWMHLRGFDEQLVLYYSDTDFQCRAAMAAPWNRRAIEAVSDLPLIHLGHRTTRRIAERSARWRADREQFLMKWPNEGPRMKSELRPQPKGSGLNASPDSAALSPRPRGH